MQTIVDICPLKPGKLAAYKAFAAEITGPRKKEFADLLKRYGLHTANTYYHKIGDTEFVVVVHVAEPDARKRLQSFGTSQNLMDQWFCKQLEMLIDHAPLNNGGDQEAQLIFSFGHRG